MKKLIFFALFVFIFSCNNEKKENKFCWICEIRVSYPSRFMKAAREEDSDNFIERDSLTVVEIREYEKINNRIEYDPRHGAVYIECTCRKK
jgi:hypothetical protein